MRVAVCLAPSVRVTALLEVRDIQGLELANEEGGCVWLRGDVDEEGALARLRALPQSEVFRWADQELLVPLGKWLPVARLPVGLSWRALSTALVLRFPVAALGGELLPDARVPFSLRRDHAVERVANLLMVSLTTVLGYMDCAAAVRLQGLRFAASGEGKVVVIGEPVLPLPGDLFHVTEGLALPLGWRLGVPVRGAMARRVLGLEEQEIAVVGLDGRFDRVCLSDFLPLSRGAVRLTYERWCMAGSEEVPS